MKIELHSRWSIENKSLVYYGLKSGKKLFKNKIKLSRRFEKFLKENNSYDLAGKKFKKRLSRLYKKEVLVESKNQYILPSALKHARVCKECCLNDFILPGVEFDENGLCPVCASKKTGKLKSILPVVSYIKASKISKYDVAVFYTGGKDSTYLLYYLSKVLNLRVLALTWEIPFMSECAKKSIQNAKIIFSNVEFIVEKFDDVELRRIYKKLMQLQNNVCACPSLAYILFYGTLVKEKVPYLVLGNEPAQMANLYFNHMAPLVAYKLSGSKLLNFLLSIPRMLALKKPYKMGQFHMISVVKQLAVGDNKLKNIAGYQNPLVSDVCAALKESPITLKQLKDDIKISKKSGNIPSLVHIDLAQISNCGKYEWSKVKEILQKEAGWVAADASKGLHTSCKIERVKEYSQWQRFKNKHSQMIPFSALELSLAVNFGSLTRQQALNEIEEHSGFCADIPIECDYIRQYLE